MAPLWIRNDNFHIFFLKKHRQDIQNLKLEKELLEQKIASLEGPPTNSNAYPSEESYSVDNEDDDDDVFWKKDNHFPNSMEQY